MAKQKPIQRSITPTEEIYFRAIEENGKKYLIGYASVFNVRSKLLFENNRSFYEVIDPKAFDEVLNDPKIDTLLTFNHSRDKVIARTLSGTLELSTDERGLLFRAELPDVSYANDVYELVLRGDLFENSFGFFVKNEDINWTKDEKGNNIRLIKKVSRLLDVSVVTEGAYATTDVFARNKNETEIQTDRGKTITITITDDDTQDEPPMEEPMMDELPTKDPSTMEDPEMDACKTKKPTQREDELEIGKRDLERFKMQVQILKLKNK
jgi:hypothetical protein